MLKRLPNSFFKKPTLDAARGLLGHTLVRKYRGRLIKGIITETEAYVGFNDLASHAARGRTKRNEIMFQSAGLVYVYLIYGMHHCLNIITERVDYPSAILIRGVKTGDINLNGPGKLTKYFHIDRTLNTKTLGSKSGLWIERGIGLQKLKIKSGARIGVNYAGSWARKPWRFFIE